MLTGINTFTLATQAHQGKISLSIHDTRSSNRTRVPYRPHKASSLEQGTEGTNLLCHPLTSRPSVLKEGGGGQSVSPRDSQSDPLSGAYVPRNSELPRGGGCLTFTASPRLELSVLNLFFGNERRRFSSSRTTSIKVNIPTFLVLYRTISPVINLGHLKLYNRHCAS